MTGRRRRISFAMRREIYDRADGKCAYCEQRLDFADFEVDHKTPLAVEPGNNELDDLQATCASCNQAKSDLTDDEYRDILAKRTEDRARPAEPCFNWSDWYAAKQEQRRVGRKEREAREYEAESTDTTMRKPLEP